MNRRSINILKEKSGIAIMTVMLFFMVIIVLIGTLSFSSMSNVRVSGANSQSMAAFYAAEAGNNIVIDEMRRFVAANQTSNLTEDQFIDSFNEKVAILNSMTYNLSPNNGSPTTVIVTIPVVDINRVNRKIEFTVKSIGTVESVSRELHTVMDIEYSLGDGDIDGFKTKHAVLVKNNFTTSSGNSTAPIIVSSTALLEDPDLTPWVATKSISQNAMFIANTSIFSNVSVELVPNAPTNVTNVESQVVRTLVANEFQDLDFTHVRSLATLATTQLANINVTSTTTLALNGGYFIVPQIDLGAQNHIVTVQADSDVFLVTDRLRFNGQVLFRGAGRVTIYVKPKMNVITSNASTYSISIMQAGNFPNREHTIGRADFEDAEKLLIYVDETSQIMDIKPINNLNLFGSFMFYNSNVTFTNNVSFGGYLMSGGTTMTLGNNSDLDSPALYYLPNANVTISNGGRVVGSIIADSVSISNGGQVAYSPMSVSLLPPIISSPILDISSSDGVQSIKFNFHNTIER